MRLCFLTPRFPAPPVKGDTLRVFHQIAALHAAHEITLFSLAEGPVAPDARAQLEALCRRVVVVPLPRGQAIGNLVGGLASRTPFQVHYYQSGAARRTLRALLAAEAFDVVHATLIRTLPYVWDLPQPPVLVDLIDSLALNLAGRRAQVRGPARLAYEIEYRRVRAYEQAVVRRFPALVVSSPADREALGGGAVTVIPNGVDGARFAFAGPADRAPGTLVFTGNMGYHPNEEAVLWFASAVWPLLRARYPALRWEIVGTGPRARVQALDDAAAGIGVLGAVDDVARYLQRATVAVCPMRSGSGIQNKVLEALATGTPVVASPIANRGVQAVAARDLLVAETAEATAAAIGRLLDSPETRARLAGAGRAFVEREFLWSGHAARLTALYTALAPQAVAI